MSIAQIIAQGIDRLYIKPFWKIMPIQVFRYLMCGMINFVVSIACYSISYNFILGKQDLDLGLITISAPVAALGIYLPINFLLGFWLQRNISFKSSPLKGHVQLIRHLTIAGIGLIITYFLTKLFVEVCHIYPTITQIIIYCITAVLTFLAQKHFTFRGAQKE